MEKKNLFDSRRNIIFLGLGFGIVIILLDNLIPTSELKPFIIIFLVLLISASLGILFPRKTWLPVMSFWILFPLNRFTKLLFYQQHKQLNNYLLLALASLLLCLLCAYASVAVRKIAARAKL